MKRFAIGLKPVNMIPLQGSTPSALRAILLGSMLSIEQNRCFVIDDPIQVAKEFFYPIGLPRDHPIVVQAIAEDRIHTVTPAEYWSNRKIFSSTASLLNAQRCEWTFADEDNVATYP
jgi:hypothetical protein